MFEPELKLVRSILHSYVTLEHFSGFFRGQKKKHICPRIKGFLFKDKHKVSG